MPTNQYIPSTKEHENSYKSVIARHPEQSDGTAEAISKITRLLLGVYLRGKARLLRFARNDKSKGLTMTREVIIGTNIRLQITRCLRGIRNTTLII